jgi:hypothetical protein
MFSAMKKVSQRCVSWIALANRGASAVEVIERLCAGGHDCPNVDNAGPLLPDAAGAANPRDVR